jgi:hypothetical protein
MARSATAQILINLYALVQNPLDLSTPSDAFQKLWNFVFANGAGNNQANQTWHDTRNLAASGTEDLDMATGGLLNGLGEQIVFSKIKAICVKADPTNVNDVLLKQSAATGVPIGSAAGAGLRAPPGGAVILIAPLAGFTVTPATGDLVTVANGGAGTGINYDIFVLGVH